MLSAVSTPLRTFVLLVLVLPGLLMAAGATSDGMPLWAPLALLAFVVILLVATLWWKADVLYGSSRVDAKVAFPEQIRIDPVDGRPQFPPTLTEIDASRCTYRVYDGNGCTRSIGRAHLLFGPGGWTFRLPVSSRPYESVSLLLFDRAGRRWEIRPFDPLETVVYPTPIKE